MSVSADLLPPSVYPLSSLEDTSAVAAVQCLLSKIWAFKLGEIAGRVRKVNSPKRQLGGSVDFCVGLCRSEGVVHAKPGSLKTAESNGIAELSPIATVRPHRRDFIPRSRRPLVIEKRLTPTYPRKRVDLLHGTIQPGIWGPQRAQWRLGATVLRTVLPRHMRGRKMRIPSTHGCLPSLRRAVRGMGDSEAGPSCFQCRRYATLYRGWRIHFCDPIIGAQLSQAAAEVSVPGHCNKQYQAWAFCVAVAAVWQS